MWSRAYDYNPISIPVVFVTFRRTSPPSTSPRTPLRHSGIPLRVYEATLSLPRTLRHIRCTSDLSIDTCLLALGKHSTTGEHRLFESILMSGFDPRDLVLQLSLIFSCNSSTFSLFLVFWNADDGWRCFHSWEPNPGWIGSCLRAPKFWFPRLIYGLNHSVLGSEQSAKSAYTHLNYTTVSSRQTKCVFLPISRSPVLTWGSHKSGHKVLSALRCTGSPFVV